ncbi:LysR family transcriptional regulator [Photobacterium sp. TY1-4]|uniref:LysR family transcriptional regulator n=1 Tax=Photobacterium sp. TY1-4 TaxID=2899122 RepID=UPI0021C0897F|nr:LysR family transcriptional regulator [Photobacterium sp. TY1-4]UXI03914.1 LysR family transcriptional regulator [Photobacterium sp. TY1-4]
MKGHSLDDLHLFVQATQYESLTQAAERLNIPLATLSRRLKRLESQLNCRLLNRSAHHFSLTRDGARYRQLCEPFIHGLENVQSRIEDDRLGLSGKIKISAPINMTQVWLKHCIYAFAEKHPDIHIELDVQNEKIDLLSNQVDLTFRVGDRIESDWIARKLWQLPFKLCASTVYLEQYAPITHPSELAQHRLLTITADANWAMQHQTTGETFQLDQGFCFTSNDVLLVRDAASQGLGIAWMPPYYFEAHSEVRHHLVPVLPDWKGHDREVYLMYRDREHRPTRIEAFIQHVLAWKSDHYRHLEMN